VKTTTRDLVLISVAAGLSIALSFLRLFEMPQGGSVTLEAIPLFYVAIRFGTVPGILAGVLSGVVQLILRPIIVHPAQILLDYPIAMGVCGLAGIFRHVDSARFLKSSLSLLLGVAIVAVAGYQWLELRRVSRTDEIELIHSESSRVMLHADADTLLGDVQARLVTFRNISPGISRVVGTVTTHGETARVWLDNATGIVRVRQMEWFGNVLVIAALFGGFALVARLGRIGSVSLGVLIATILKWAVHVVSGAIFFSAYAPLGENVWLYSMAYNAAYGVPQALLALLIVPAVLRRPGLAVTTREQTS
jgi:thiamine transporter ThiT